MNSKKYKSMAKFRIYRNRSKRRYYRKYDFSIGKRKKYTPAQDAMVLKHYMPDTELAAVLQRSVNSIQLRRVKLKKILAVHNSPSA
jgi:hypothetical protein